MLVALRCRTPSPWRTVRSAGFGLSLLATLGATLVAALPAGAKAVAKASSEPIASLAAPLASGPITNNGKRECVYSALSIGVLNQFERMVGRRINCVLVYNDAAPTWAGWETPWFIGDGNPDINWANWVAAAKGRTLIITENMFPTSVDSTNWRQAGADGAFTSHAKILARNLVAAGLGSSVIRLGHEANGSWYPDNIGDTPRDYRLWKQFWRVTVLAMRSVPGADFRFDWCVNAGYRDIPFADYYPGNDVVDIIGVDAYDAGLRGNTPNRWNTLYNEPGGLADVLAFAKAHNKPLSIPEWGVAPKHVAFSGGDDPAYVNGIANVVANNEVAYQSYFYHLAFATALSTFTKSLSAYRRDFGRALVLGKNHRVHKAKQHSKRTSKPQSKGSRR